MVKSLVLAIANDLGFTIGMTLLLCIIFQPDVHVEGGLKAPDVATKNFSLDEEVHFEEECC